MNHTHQDCPDHDFPTFLSSWKINAIVCITRIHTFIDITIYEIHCGIHKLSSYIHIEYYFKL